MSIKCGRCGQRHETVEDVRACYNGQDVASTPEPVQGSQYRATDGQVRFLGKLFAQTGARLVSGEALDTLPKRGPGSASELIDGMLKFLKGGPKPIGVAFAIVAPAKPVAPRQVREGGKAKYDVPSGYYATPSLTGNNDLDFWKIERPTEGKWTGYTFVKRVIGGHDDTAIPRASRKKVKSEKVNSRVTQEAALAKITEFGTQKAHELFGTELKFCRRCGIHLTDETSRSLGIGPDCRSK